MKPELLRRLQDPFLKVFARRSTRRLLCTAHGGEAGIVAIARHRGLFCSSWSLIASIGVAADWAASGSW
jgi:hypothetical protein